MGQEEHSEILCCDCIHKHIASRASRAYEESNEQAHASYWFLIENYRWAISSLSIEVMKVNPATDEVDDDPLKNTKVQYWLEGGEYEKGHGYTHDYRLDCGGDSFGEALNMYAFLVQMHYPLNVKKPQ